MFVVVEDQERAQSLPVFSLSRSRCLCFILALALALTYEIQDEKALSMRTNCAQICCALSSIHF